MSEIRLDYERARAVFEEYLDQYDRQDDKIRLKVVHTFGVVKCAAEIAGRMGLAQGDLELAKIIALLHDIGRFEQVRRFNSFEADTMDHAAAGVEILFGEKQMIREFLPEAQGLGRDWRRVDRELAYGIIETAIAKHSDFELQVIDQDAAKYLQEPDGGAGFAAYRDRILLHARLIRDADKLDNCRVKLAEPMETMLGVSEKEAGKGKISPRVWDACLRKQSVLSSDRVSKVDYWVSYLAQYYDINFPATREIIREKDYICRIAKRLTYEDGDTREKVRILLDTLSESMKNVTT